MAKCSAKLPLNTDLALLRGKLSLNRLAQVIFEFGRGVGNPNETVLYVDYIYFVASKPIAGSRGRDRRHRIGGRRSIQLSYADN